MLPQLYFVSPFRRQAAERHGDVLLGPACVKNKLTCKDVTSVYGYPKSLDMLLGIKLTSEEAAVKGTTTRRYLRNLPLDPLTGKADWLFRCYKDAPNASNWWRDPDAKQPL